MRGTDACRLPPQRQTHQLSQTPRRWRLFESGDRFAQFNVALRFDREKQLGNAERTAQYRFLRVGEHQRVRHFAAIPPFAVRNRERAPRQHTRQHRLLRHRIDRYRAVLQIAQRSIKRCTHPAFTQRARMDKDRRRHCSPNLPIEKLNRCVDERRCILCIEREFTDGRAEHRAHKAVRVERRRIEVGDHRPGQVIEIRLPDTMRARVSIQERIELSPRFGERRLPGGNTRQHLFEQSQE